MRGGDPGRVRDAERQTSGGRTPGRLDAAPGNRSVRAPRCPDPAWSPRVTTILAVTRDGRSVLGGDGQVTLGNTDEFGVELGLQDSLLYNRGIPGIGYNFNNTGPLGNNSTAFSNHFFFSNFLNIGIIR